MAGALARIFAGYRVGRLEFQEHQFFDAREGFVHLGFRFLLVGERVAVAPSTSNAIRLMSRVERRITAVDDVELVTGSAQFIREEAAAFAIMPQHGTFQKSPRRPSSFGLMRLIVAAEQRSTPRRLLSTQMIDERIGGWRMELR